MALHIATTDDLADLERDIARILAEMAVERAARQVLEDRVAALESAASSEEAE